MSEFKKQPKLDNQERFLDLIGEAKYGNERKKGKFFKVLPNKNNVFRILPPFGSFKDKGKWYAFYRIVWGYKDSNGKLRPFSDVREFNFKTQMVEKESPAFLKVKMLREKKEKAKKLLNEGKISEEQYQVLVDLVKRYTIQSRYFLNVVSLDGEIGLLSLNKRLFQALRAEILRLRQEKVEPIGGLTGVFFNFTKVNETGELQDWVFSVRPYKETVKAIVGGEETFVERVKKHTIDPAFAKRMQEECFDLGKLYLQPTFEEVAEIVKAGENHEEVVDRVFKKYREGKNNSFQNTPSPSLSPQQQTQPKQAATDGVMTEELAKSAPLQPEETDKNVSGSGDSEEEVLTTVLLTPKETEKPAEKEDKKEAVKEQSAGDDDLVSLKQLIDQYMHE